MLISIASPIYLARQKQLRFSNIVVSVLAIILMLIPALGSIGVAGNNFLSQIFPIPAPPYNLFPYLLLLYLTFGRGWFAIIRSRSPEIIQQMEEDTEERDSK